MKEIPKQLIDKTRTFLGGPGLVGETGADFFNRIFKAHGTLNTVIWEGGLPHPIHLREGMTIRNFMRESGLCEDWTDHDLDNNWEELIILALNLK